jgi:small subunit ribosomal protein S6
LKDQEYQGMPLYESTFITRQDMSRQDITKLCDSFTAIIEQGGGKIVKNEYWGLRNFAYRINKSRKGHYTMLAIDAPPAAIKEMERNIGINEDILRSLTVRVDVLEEGPSAMMQQARSREEGYGGDTDIVTEAEERVAAAN